jgi:hypothetical protein
MEPPVPSLAVSRTTDQENPTATSGHFGLSDAALGVLHRVNGRRRHSVQLTASSRRALREHPAKAMPRRPRLGVLSLRDFKHGVDPADRLRSVVATFVQNRPAGIVLHPISSLVAD